MRFALLGDHPDGLDFARALAASGRHEIAAYTGAAEGLEDLHRLGIPATGIADVEEILADSEIGAVIVASPLATRRDHLLRALRSEIHVLCVHPAHTSPDVAYEAALVQVDTGCVLLPLLAAALHPAIARLAELVKQGTGARLLEMEIWSTDDVLLEAAEGKPSFPGWDVLRALGGEIEEVFLQSTRTELSAEEPLTLSGRFVGGLLFHVNLVPQQADAHWRLSLVSSIGRANLVFSQGWPGPAQLSYVDEAGMQQDQAWDEHHPWRPLIERFERAEIDASKEKPKPGSANAQCLTSSSPALGWQDELRALELDDAARRSLERGRSSTLDLQEVTEEAAFKGTMTLVGCSLIWLAVIALIASFWWPQVAWAIVPMFALFLLLQALRWVLPTSS